MKKSLASLFLLFTILLPTTFLYSQNDETEKVLFIKEVNMKYKKSSEYTFLVGYVANQDRQISLQFSGGPSELKFSKSVFVKKGHSIVKIKLKGSQEATVGKGYRISLSLRERGGDWKTIKTSVTIKNIEVVADKVTNHDNASLPSLISNKINSASFYDFKIDYDFAKENLIQVSIYQGKKGVGSSKKLKVTPGSGSKTVRVAFKEPIKGSGFRFKLSFGTANDFDTKNTKTKEITGIEIVKPIERLSISDLNKKSTLLTLKSNSTVLLLPGDPVYKTISIIATNGKEVKIYKDTNKIDTKTLKMGAYFVITNSGYYFKFMKK